MKMKVLNLLIITVILGLYPQFAFGQREPDKLVGRIFPNVNIPTLKEIENTDSIFEKHQYNLLICNSLSCGYGSRMLKMFKDSSVFFETINIAIIHIQAFSAEVSDLEKNRANIKSQIERGNLISSSWYFFFEEYSNSRTEYKYLKTFATEMEIQVCPKYFLIDKDGKILMERAGLNLNFINDLRHYLLKQKK